MSEVLVYERGEWLEEEEYSTWDFEDYCYECGGYGDDYSFIWNEVAHDYDIICNCDDCAFNPLRSND